MCGVVACNWPKQFSCTRSHICLVPGPFPQASLQPQPPTSRSLSQQPTIHDHPICANTLNISEKVNYDASFGFTTRYDLIQPSLRRLYGGFLNARSAKAFPTVRTLQTTLRISLSRSGHQSAHHSHADQVTKFPTGDSVSADVSGN